ncbi:MAG: glycosyltransferase [Peptostreptococcaceae bacterium]
MNNYYNVSIITITKRINYIDNILNNFLRQNIECKELIIVINNDKIKLDNYYLYTKLYDNIKLYKLDEKTSLGMCLNFACDKCKYELIAKFDDDDYYGTYYLNEVCNTFVNVDCDIVGKYKNFYYIEKYNMLTLKTSAIENIFSNTVLGSTLCFKNYVFHNIKFKDIDCLEDRYFNNDCIKKGYKIYASSRYNHIVFKHNNIDDHTFRSNLDFIMKISTEIESSIHFSDCFSLVDKNIQMKIL